MADTISVHPYEIIIRFACEIGERAGAMRGLHLAQLPHVVDANGLIARKLPPGPDELAQPFPQEQLQALLGEAAVKTLAQLADMDAKVQANATALKAEKAAHAQTSDTRDGLAEHNKKMRKDFQRLHTSLLEAQALLAAYEAKFGKLKG